MILHYFPIANYYLESRYNNNEWNFNIFYTLETLYKGRDLGYTFFYLSVLQIRRDKMDNLGVIFHIAALKRMLRPIIRTVSVRLFQ